MGAYLRCGRDKVYCCHFSVEMAFFMHMENIGKVLAIYIDGLSVPSL